MIKKNDLFEAEITAMTAEGSGICRADGMAVFVPGTAVGDRCVVRVVKVLKKYAFGRLEELLTPSPDRTTPDCPIAGPCGGCVYRHITYEAELKIKTQRVRDALERIGGFENIPMETILGAPSRTRYRNKCQLPIGLSKNGEMQMGFYAVNSHRIIDTHTCLLQPEVFDRAAEAFRAWQKLSGESIYDEAAHSGVLRHLYMRCGEKSGEVLVCIVANGAKLHGEDLLVKMLREAVPEITGIVLNINRERTNVVLGRELRTLWGKPTIRDTLCRLEFEISPHAFYQVNRTQAEALYNKAAEYAGLTGAETLLDLYCGTGTIGLSMASRAKKLIGAEIIPSAVENARKNAAHNHVTNAEFLCGDAKDAARILYERGERPDVRHPRRRHRHRPPAQGLRCRRYLDHRRHAPHARRLRLLRPRHPRPRREAAHGKRLHPPLRRSGRSFPKMRACGDGYLTIQILGQFKPKLSIHFCRPAVKTEY